MKFIVSKGKIESSKADILVVSCFEKEKKDEERLSPATLGPEDGGTVVDKKFNNGISKMIVSEEFLGASGDYKLIFTGGRLNSRYILLVGLGKKRDVNLDTLRRIGGVVAKAANEVKARSVAMVFQKTAIGDFKVPDRVQSVVEGMLLGAYTFEIYKDKLDRSKLTLKEVYIFSSVNPAQVERSINIGKVIAEATNLARDLENTPGIDKTPEILAKKVKDIAAHCKLKCEIMGLDKIKSEKMNLFLAVAKGSAEAPRFIHLSYGPSKKARAKMALVGKGITFDAGGISLKPTRGMEQMKEDMGGAAAVIGIMKAISELKLNVAVDAYIPACENMPDGRAIKPGDIIKSREGKTVEIITTDAEGRMILADALSYAVERKPDYIIDLATLTGHCVYAVGERYVAILGNDQKLIDRLINSGRRAGEPLWQLPLEQEYKKKIKKGIADLRNEGATKAGTIDGALFLEEFVGKTKWAHLDIASTVRSDEDQPYIPKGCTGVGVRTLLYFLMGLS